MDDIRGIPASRLSQIVDRHPIARIALDFGSSSAPCSPRLGARIHESCGSPEESRGRSLSGPDESRERLNAFDFNQIETGSLRILPRRVCQVPVPSPQPRINKDSSPVPFRDSPYVNVPNLIFHKSDSFFQAARNAGYVELKDSNNSGSNSSRNCIKSYKCSPYNFSSESSGQEEYADTRIFGSQTDFGPKCFENKANDIQNLNCMHSPYDSGSSCRGGNFERSISFCSRKHPDGQKQRYSEEDQSFVDRKQLSAGTAEGKKGSRVVHSASKSFDGFSNTIGEFNWQERCLELQLELHRSRSQATRIRDMLREKLSELERRVLEAEGRADVAKDKEPPIEEANTETQLGDKKRRKGFTVVNGTSSVCCPGDQCSIPASFVFI